MNELLFNKRKSGLLWWIGPLLHIKKIHGLIVFGQKRLKGKGLVITSDAAFDENQTQNLRAKTQTNPPA